MATKIIYIDDLDGSENAETVAFSFQGMDYSIDLTENNLNKLHKALAPFVENARKVDAPSPKRQRASHTNTTEIRNWLRENGHSVPDRGTIRGDLLKLWEAR